MEYFYLNLALKGVFDTHSFVAKFEINQMTNKKDVTLKPPQNVRSVTLLV